MHKNDLPKFLNGELNPEQVKARNSVEGDFIDLYKKIFEQRNSEVPDFNVFEKVETVRIRRLSKMKRFIAYAATIVLFIGLYVVYQEIQPFNKQNSVSALELNELKINTEQSLLMFSKELNVCIAEIEKAQKARQPLTETYSIEHFRIEFDNPTKNIKIN